VSTTNKFKDYRVNDFLVSGEEFSLVPNEKYGYLETRTQPSPEDLPSYYESDSYISHTDSKKGLLSFLYQMVKSYSLKKKVRLIRKLNSGTGTLLDIGAGTGDFLKEAEKRGWNAFGIEPNENARKAASEKNIELHTSLDDLDGRKFDVITLWHVLEHLPNLEESISRIVELMSEKGILIIAVPNFNSWDADYYKSYWAAFDVPRHLWHFSRKSMRKVIPSKLELVKTKPLIFDAYYVSLLSEKYRSGNRFSLKALWIGWRSNWAARSSGEYSSLIYCFKIQN
jgi:2-polyprenyl-3-methyl-5-hydroxy-6-metoxy-1,4-benzoquinol methylase